MIHLQRREDDEGDLHVGLAHEVERGDHEEAADVEEELAHGGDVARPARDVGLHAVSKEDFQRQFRWGNHKGCSI